MPTGFWSVVAFVYGTIVGSFLNVCIYRLPEEQSVVTPPSHCPKCNTKLKGIDLVPLFSFLMLGRKCRYCKAPISWRYFTIELITGALFVATYLRYHFAIDFFPYVLFISALVVAFVVDMELFIIPDEVSIAGIVLGVGKDVAHLVAGDAGHYLVRIPLPFTDFRLPMLPSVVGFVVCGGLFYLIAYISFYAFRPKDEEERKSYQGAMGGGDVKLAAATGAVLGAAPALASFLIAVLLGTFFGVAFVVARSIADKRGMPWRTEIPFGPYMVAGSLAVLLLHPQLRHVWTAWVRLVTRT